MKKKKDFQSKWENYWYYYKYHTLAAVFVLIMICVFINDKLQQVDYDYRISAVTDYNLAEEQLNRLEEAFTNVADDRNGDGEIHVLVSNYTITKDGNENPQVEMANQTKFMADLETGDSLIFIYSDDVYDIYKDDMIFDVKDKTQVKLSECKENTETDLGELNIAMRVFEGTSLEKKDKLKEYYNDSQKLLEKFKNGK